MSKNSASREKDKSRKKEKKEKNLKNAPVSMLRLTHSGVGNACCAQAGVVGDQFGNTEAPWQHVEGARLVHSRKES